MYPIKKILAVITLAATILPTWSVMALTVTEAVTDLQTIDPLLPVGVENPKGSIGFILANIFGTGNGKIQSQYLDYAGISIWTQSGSNAWYAGTGSVGIGTTSPAASLEVKRSVADANYAGWIEWTDTANLGLGVNIANTASAGVIANFKAGNISRFFIRGDGNVGIGTTGPAASLEVKRSVADANYAGWIEWTDTANFGLGVNIANTGSGTPIVNFKSDNISKLYIGGDGNVGIGTITPSEKFDVTGNGKFSGTVTAAIPTIGSHLATKDYVDAAVVAAGGWSNIGGWYIRNNYGAWSCPAPNPATSWCSCPTGFSAAPISYDAASYYMGYLCYK